MDALFLGSPVHLLLRTRLASARLMPTVNHLRKYVKHLRCGQQTSDDRGCGKIQNRKKKQKSLTVKPKTKQKSNFQIKKLFEYCFPERKRGKFMETWLR